MTYAVDVGKIRFNWRGTYDETATYTPLDVVYHSGSSWVCVTPNDIYGEITPITGITPEQASPSWDKIAQGSDFGGLPNLQTGSTPVYDGTEYVNVNPSADYQSLVVRSGIPEYKPQGVIQLQHKNIDLLGRFNNGSTVSTTYNGSRLLNSYYDNSAWVNNSVDYFVAEITPKFDTSVVKVTFNWQLWAGGGHFQVRVMRWDSVSEAWSRPDFLENKWVSAGLKSDQGAYSNTTNGAYYVYTLMPFNRTFIDDTVEAGVTYKYTLEAQSHNSLVVYFNYNPSYYNQTYSFTPTSNQILEEINNGD